MSSLLRGLKLIDLCTPSISYDAQVKSASAAFDNQCYEIIDETGQVIMIPSIMDLQDSNLVDILAWQFHVDFYDKSRDLEFRKRLVQLSIQWHITKGTPALVQEVLDTYWKGGATLTEWFEYRDPFPPNYPTEAADTIVGMFGPAAINVSANTITIANHGLVNGDTIRFVTGGLAVSGKLPTPILPTFYYYVVNVAGNSFQISTTKGGSPLDITDTGQGSSNEIWKLGTGSWHDRYRFRVYVDQQIIAPEDEAQVLALIQRYKPVSRWLEGIYQARASECDIGWYGGVLRFVYRNIDAPNYP